MDLELVLGYSAMPVEISLMMICLAIFFIVGVFGNMTVIVRIIRTHRQFRRMYGRDDSRRLTLQRYVMALACVDLFVTIQIPIFFPYLYSGQWLIGATMCKAFWVVDNVNRFFSVHILTAMAVERFLIVRHSVHSKNQRAVPFIAKSVFLFTSAAALVLLSPLLSFVQLDVLEFPGHPNPVVITTCVTPMPDLLYVIFTWYMFVLGYLAPLFIICGCYKMLVNMLRKRYKLTNMQENSKTQLVQKVSKSIICVTAFHFICWTPFWFAQIIPIVLWDVENVWPEATVRFQMASLLTPYVNSSFNWCFYVLLNQRLRKQIFRRSSSHYSAVK